MSGFRNTAFTISALFTVGLTFGTASPALAGVFIPITPPSGSTSSYVLGINDTDSIVGAYSTSDNIEHGFFGLYNSTYTTVDVGADGTVLRAINNSGYITGYANGDDCNEYSGGCPAFERGPSGTIVQITDGGVQLYGIPGGVNNSKNEFVGEYYDSATNTLNGYYGKSGKYLKALTLSVSTPYTHPRGINDTNVVVGFFWNSSNTESGFLLSKGVTTVINYPSKNAIYTYMASINDKGVAVGTWLDSNSNGHAFLFDTNSDTFTPIKVPKSTSSGASGINTDGLVIVSSSDGTDYIWCPTRKNCPGEGIEAPDEPFRVLPGVLPRYHCARECTSFRQPVNLNIHGFPANRLGAPRADVFRTAPPILP